MNMYSLSLTSSTFILFYFFNQIIKNPVFMAGMREAMQSVLPSAPSSNQEEVPTNSNNQSSNISSSDLSIYLERVERGMAKLEAAMVSIYCRLVLSIRENNRLHIPTYRNSNI
jgi:hypothetical protein